MLTETEMERHNHRENKQRGLLIRRALRTRVKVIGSVIISYIQ